MKRLIKLDEFSIIFEPYRFKSCVLLHPGGNAGDHMIIDATLVLLRHFNIEFKGINIDNDIDVIFYSGGANIGLYKSSVSKIRMAEEMKAKYQCDLVVLPHTFSSEFKNSNFDKIYVRDVTSLNLVKDSVLIPDIALSLEVEIEYKGIVNESGSFFRTDSEMIDVPVDNIGDPCSIARNSYQYLNLAAQYKTIRTNRLHFAIAGLLLGRNVILYDNNYHKNRSVYDSYLKDLGCKWSVINK